MKESDIVFETSQGIWVGHDVAKRSKHVYTVYVTGPVMSVADSTYDDKDTAIIRAEYLSKRRPTRKDVIELHDSIMKFRNMEQRN